MSMELEFSPLHIQNLKNWNTVLYDWHAWPIGLVQSCGLVGVDAAPVVEADRAHSHRRPAESARKIELRTIYSQRSMQYNFQINCQVI